MDDWKLKVKTAVKLEKRDVFVSLYCSNCTVLISYFRLRCCNSLIYSFTFLGSGQRLLYRLVLG